MATAISNTATTPNALRYTITSTDATALTAISQASLAAACAAGPLKQFLLGLTTAQFNALEQNPALSVVAIGAGAAMSLAADFSGGNLTITPNNTAGATATITLRFIQSDDR